MAKADWLAEALGDLPLTLAQASRLLAETGLSVNYYVELLETRAGDLLDQSPPESHPHSLATAIRLGTDRLAEADPVALALVRLAAFLAPEPVPAAPLPDAGCEPPSRRQARANPAFSSGQTR